MSVSSAERFPSYHPPIEPATASPGIGGMTKAEMERANTGNDTKAVDNLIVDELRE